MVVVLRCLLRDRIAVRLDRPSPTRPCTASPCPTAHSAKGAATTISPDKASIGSQAVACLIGRLDGSRAAEPAEVQVPYTLVTRESTLGR